MNIEVGKRPTEETIYISDECYRALECLWKNKQDIVDCDGVECSDLCPFHMEEDMSLSGTNKNKCLKNLLREVIEKAFLIVE